jgi:glycosyltransferase involved in cell wall biosynthesis
MKICYLANASSIHAIKMARFFATGGHEVHFISFEAPLKNETGITFHVIRTNKKTLFLTFLFKAIRIKKLFHAIKPDIIHAHYLTKYGIIAWITGFHPCVVSVIGSDILTDAKGIRKIPAIRVLRSADCIHCDGKNSFAEILSYGIPRQKVHLIYFGVDVSLFTPAIRDISNAENKKIVIISSRKLERLYDITSLIEAIPVIRQSLRDFVVMIIGSGPQMNMLEKKARDLSIPDYVKFYGRVPNEDLPDYLVSADIYVSTSLSDAGIAVSTAEAMACGLPVISTEGGDNAEWIEDGVNGFLIPKHSPGALAEKILLLAQNPEMRKDFGIKNRRIIELRFNNSHEMMKILKIYQELVQDVMT